MRGRGLLAKAIIKAQMASPNFTHVYAALISVINTKLPEIGNLIVSSDLRRLFIKERGETRNFPFSITLHQRDFHSSRSRVKVAANDWV